MKSPELNMSSMFSSLSLKRKDSSETFVSDNNSTVKKITDEGDSIASMSSEWHSQRRYYIALLKHIKAYDKELDLNYCKETIKKNSKDTINHLRSKIEISPGVYQIEDWNKAVANREKIVKLQALFSENPTDNSYRYEVLNMTITTACWKQMDGIIEIAESIPQIGKTWLAPIVVLLSKFPYFEASVQNITYNHYQAMKWEKSIHSISITKGLNPLRENILEDLIIPKCQKLNVFQKAARYKLNFKSDHRLKSFKEARDLLYRDLKNEIFIDDDKWNSHVQFFLLELQRTLPCPGFGLRFF